MRRDSIFYSLFRQSPSLLFELLDEPPESAQRYRFDSVAVKEPKFEIDGVFLPPESEPPGTVFFAEVQMQKDQELYERLFSESFLYFSQNRNKFSDWQAVLVYPSRSMEQSNSHPYRALINSDQVHRFYLDTLGEISELPLGLALMVLTIVKKAKTVEAAKLLMIRAQQESVTAELQQGIIEMISKIVVYRFNTLSRQEIDEMLGTKLEETRVYQEAKEEGEEGRARTIALNMLRDKFTIEQISRLTGLTIAQIQALQTS
jgi:predicted transposase/invertase (TIGR01784 family)